MISPAAQRVQFLRAHVIELQSWLDQWPPAWADRITLRQAIEAIVTTGRRRLQAAACALIAGDPQ